MSPKKNIILLCVLIFSFTISGCGNSIKNIDGGEEWNTLFDKAEILMNAADIDEGSALTAASKYESVESSDIVSAYIEDCKNGYKLHVYDENEHEYWFYFDENGNFRYIEAICK